jgi:TetR/AcrR family transcriptional regulator
MTNEEPDTEAKIKEAARKVFLANGYEGTKIRQIADEAGVNIALVNYYFRSKEALFKAIYIETFGAFFGTMMQLLNEPTPLEVKIWKIVDRYTDFLLVNPLMPQFVLAEHGKNGVNLFKDMNIRELIKSARLVEQLREEAEAGRIRPIEPLQFIITLMSNIAFPIIARPVVGYVGDFGEAGFRQFMETRKTIIPEMIMCYLRAA